MLSRRLALLVAITALAFAACQPESPSASGPDGELAIPRLEPESRTLANGLRVYALPDATTANVSVAVWYAVGSKHDPAGRSGFAHLFEHLMFKSTTNMPAGTIYQLTDDVGGILNASTGADFTKYYETVPANHLERVLWAEAERMGSLVVDDSTLQSERAVVQEEFRQRVLAEPYGRLLSLHLAQTNFDVHPYGRPSIGSIADLEAATLDDVRAFHAAYYRPDNAILVVAGNFDPPQLDAWVDRYFGPLTSPGRPIPQVDAVEPQRTEPKSLTIHAPNVPLPAVTISWPAPAANSPDIAAWMALDAILQRGSSRLTQALINRKRLAAQVGSVLEIRQQPGTYTLLAVLSKGKSVDSGLKALQAEVAKIRKSPVSAAALDEARNELITQALRGRETSSGRADELARSVLLFGDAAGFDNVLAQLQKVTAADVQRVARSIMDDRLAVTIRYLPETAGATGDAIADSQTIQTAKIDIPRAEIPVHSLASARRRQQPPEPATAIQTREPAAVAETTLANGLRVIVAHRPALPLVAVELRIAAGAALDPDNRAGLAAMTANFTTRGTTRRRGIWRQLEGLGALLGTAADFDASSMSLVARADKTREAFLILADLVQSPAFSSRELKRLRQGTLDTLAASLQRPATLGRVAMARRLFGDAPYGRNPSPRSISGVTRAEATDFHGKWWRPDNAILVISGDITPEAGFALAQEALGGWKKPVQPLPASGPAAGATPVVSTLPLIIDMPNTGQAVVLMGHMGPARTSEDYFATVVANEVVGGGHSSRLSQEIRVKRGLSYDAGSRIAVRRQGAPIIAAAQTRHEAVVEVVELMSAELGRLGVAEIPAAELASRKAALIGGFGRDVETTGGLARQLSALAQFGLPLSKLQTFAADIAAVTTEQAAAAARQHFDPAAVSLVVVGDAKVFAAALEEKFPQLERLEVHQLNLDSATLR